MTGRVRRIDHEAAWRLLMLGLLATLTACGRSERPASVPAKPISVPSSGQTKACLADLDRDRIRYKVLPDKDYGGGCGVIGTIQLLDIGVPVTNLTAVRCGEARAFVGWIRNAVAPAAYQMLGSELVRVDSMGSYACRNVVGSRSSAGRRSGHAIANAIDVAGFVLRDGRRVTVLTDWNSSDARVRQFVAAVHASACRRFGTVLSPAYNAAHRDHLHLEDDGARFCR